MESVASVANLAQALLNVITKTKEHPVQTGKQ